MSRKKMEISHSKNFLTIVNPLFIKEGFITSSTNKLTKKTNDGNIAIAFKFSHSFEMISLKEVLVVITYNTLKKEMLNLFGNYCDERKKDKTLIYKRCYSFWFDEGLNFAITGTLKKPLLEYYKENDYAITTEKFMQQLYPDIIDFINAYADVAHFTRTLKKFAVEGITDKKVYSDYEFLLQYFISEKYLSKPEQAQLWAHYLNDDRKASKEFYPVFFDEMKRIFEK